MNRLHAMKNIEQALKDFPHHSLVRNARNLLNTLGYQSEITVDFESNLAEAFISNFDLFGKLNKERALVNEWESIDLLFQLTAEEISGSTQKRLPFNNQQIDNTIIESYLFFALKLQANTYTRTQLANITREINKLTPMPAMIIFQHGQTLTFAVINRRLHKRDGTKDVLEKVTLIKDIDFQAPHPAHIKILFELSCEELFRVHGFSNFVELHRAWTKTLDIQELNRQFYRELSHWYFWAVENVTFPDDAGADSGIRNATSVIRLITRLIFAWFIKEKRLVPDTLFTQREIEKILVSTEPQESTYYKAILQNLFFATLNQEMNTPEKPTNRKFRGDGRQHYNITSLYRYKSYFNDADEALRLFEQIPFLNGGLFECLDKKAKGESKNVLRVDGFSDRDDNPLSVPNFLFFSEEKNVDLNKVYDTKGKRYKVSGLIEILHRYKFTITENTPIEEEIALDPELLGKVFENLLAAYNPETGVTARKQTGSFYTPREIVDYMVNESLVAYLKTELETQQTTMSDSETSDIEKRLRHLIAYNDAPHQFNDEETTQLIKAIDTLKILDPACGSGAFPMGVLHKLVFILAKLDPRNDRWRQRQIARVENTIKAAEAIDDSTVRENTIRDLEGEINNINEAFERNELDYGRKLFLIENCIYGVDIQPVAAQIAKLRCFISLIVDQKIDDTLENRGVRPLPNLETKFVSANALLGITGQLSLRTPEIIKKEKELEAVRRRHFTARTPRTKTRYRERDAVLRAEIGKLLNVLGLPSSTAQEIAAWDPYDQNASADFFDPEWMFGLAEGFNITIGNPPYVRADAEGLQTLRQQIRDSNQYETLYGKWDLYIPFIERSYKLLKPGGFTTLIVSDAYCHAKYAQKSHDWFLKNSRILRLDFLSNLQIFDAAVKNLIYLFQRTDGNRHQPNRRVHALEFGDVTSLPTNEQRSLTSRVFFPEDTGAEQFSIQTVTLDKICYITTGMSVHAHSRRARGAFKEKDVVSDTRDELHPKPFVEGKHLGRWIPVTHKWLEWGTERAPSLFNSVNFPELYEVDENILAPRNPGPDPKACYDDQNLIFTANSIGFILWHHLAGVRNKSIKQRTRYQDETPQRSDLPQREELEKTSRRFSVKFLLGVMNSNFAHNFLRANRRSNISLYPDDWKQLPVPDVSPQQQVPIVTLVDEILSAKRADLNADVSALEDKLDRGVAALYGIIAE